MFLADLVGESKTAHESPKLKEGFFRNDTFHLDFVLLRKRSSTKAANAE
jgi:hypothetical protein